jgi:hypothetical protein
MWEHGRSVENVLQDASMGCLPLGLPRFAMVGRGKEVLK